MIESTVVAARNAGNELSDPAFIGIEERASRRSRNISTRVLCACEWMRQFPTRRQALSWLEAHVEAMHGDEVASLTEVTRW